MRLTATLSQWVNVAESCVWEALSGGSNQLDQVVGQLREFFSWAKSGAVRSAKSEERDVPETLVACR